MPPSSQNQAGFWENMSIYRINEQLLEFFGGSWYKPPTLPPGWPDEPRLEQLRQKAATVVEGLATSGQRWGFKDPRTVITLPFWRRVIGEMDYVICIRHPQAFIGSVRDLPAPEATPLATTMLWLDMNFAALSQTINASRTFIFYDDWLTNTRETARQLAAFIHGEAPCETQKMLDAIETFVDPKLRHVNAIDEKPVPGASELEEVYAALRSIASNDPNDIDARVRHLQDAEFLAEAFRSRHAPASSTP